MYIGDLARASGFSVDTLRWYEKIGLIRAPLRDGGGRRVYAEETTAWTRLLGRLKATGMSVADMCEYARLREGGRATVADRREILERHRGAILARMAELADGLELVDRKIGAYRAAEVDADASEFAGCACPRD